MYLMERSKRMICSGLGNRCKFGSNQFRDCTKILHVAGALGAKGNLKLLTVLIQRGTILRVRSDLDIKDIRNESYE